MIGDVTQRNAPSSTTSDLNTPTSNPFAEPSHPDHRLYAELKKRIADASENRLAQMTAACHMAGIKPGRLGDIRIGDRGIVIAPDGGPGRPVLLDNTIPASPVQKSAQKMPAYDNERAMRRQLDA